MAFFAWGALLLPPWALAVLAVVCFAPAVVAGRVAWYKNAFNFVNYVLAGTVAHLVASQAVAVGSVDGRALGSAAALAAAALLLVATNHALLGVMIRLAYGRPLRRAYVTLARSAPLDVAMALTGASVAVLWLVAPEFTLLAAGPIILILSALRVPTLEHLSRTDPKTGLYNLAHFKHELADALAVARRQGSPLAVVMIDLDHLREVNNRFGHLVGDLLITEVARIVAEHGDSEGSAARFGGEEFCLLLREASGEARRRAEAIRARVENLHAVVDGIPVRVTISAGVAVFPEHADDVEELLQAADVALYDAKISGRNRVRAAMTPEARTALALPGAGSSAAPNGRRPSASESVGEAPRQESVADRLAPSPVSPSPPTDTATPATTVGVKRSRSVRWFVAALFLAALGVAVLSSPDRIAAAPALFAVLVGAVVALDRLSIDLFDRGNVSPGSVPTMALAFLFGPLGPIASEAAVALVRAIRREPPIRYAFDFGALSLAGAAAAAVFALAGGAGPAALLGTAAVAGAVYYGVNIPLLAIVMGVSEGRPPLMVWRERLGWLFPQYPVFGLIAAGVVLTEHAVGLYALLVFAVPVLMLLVVERQYVNRSRSGVRELRGSNDALEAANAELRRLLGSNEQLLREMHRSYLATITSLARTIEAKDPYTGGHTERVARVACALAAELGMTAEELDAVEVGGVIHDIGKIGIPDAVLLKPGRLTEEEFAEMRRHPVISSYIVGDLELPAIVKQMARSHHERYDGGGYPDGLAGEEIPLAARILTVSDALDAMTSDRPYRDALPLATALEEIIDKAGTQFCPQVVDALRARLERDPTLGGEYKSSAALAVGTAT